MSNFFKGLNGYFLAHSFIKEHKLWKFVLLPGVINLALLIGVIYSAITLSDYVVTSLLDLVGFADWIPDLVADSLKLVMRFIVKSLVITCYFIIYKNLILIIMSPFMSYLAEVVHESRTGIKKEFELEQFIKDTVRGIRIATRNLFLEFFWIALFFMLGFIFPPSGLISPFILFIIQWYFYGFSMIDYGLEARNMTYKESIISIKKNKGIAIGNGLGFYLLMLIPFVGWMFAPTYGVIAAYLSTEDKI